MAVKSKSNPIQVSIEDCYFQLREQFKTLYQAPAEQKATPEWMVRQTDLVRETVRSLAAYNNSLVQNKFSRQLCAEFKIGINDFNQAAKDIKLYSDDDPDGEEEQETVSKTARVEGWIDKHYDLFFNEVSHRFIGRKKGEPEMYEIKLENLYRDLDLAHLKYSWSDLKIILRSDYVKKMNPFQNYFESLPPWDGNDWIEILGEYLKITQINRGMNEKERFRNQFKKMFVRSVACALEADFNKHCFTLCHEQQSSGKSTFLRWLCPPQLKDYYSENTGLSKDDRIALAENFLINIDELDVMGKYDINSLKSLVSKDGFKERLPYGERTEFLKRRCNFVASTNRKEFLADETGSVRWICFQLDKIDWAYKDDIDINKVWSQAYHLFKNTNFRYQLSHTELQENEIANRQFFMRSQEMELIEKHFQPATQEDIDTVDRKHMTRVDDIQFLTATEIKEDLTLRSVIKDHLSNINIGKALKFLGFEQRSERFSGEESRKGYWIKENDGYKRWRKDNERF